jgi:N-acetyltransferase
MNAAGPLEPASGSFIEPVTLRGAHATLEPLTRGHDAAIKAAAADGELWKLWYTSVPTPDKTAEWMDIALDMRERLGAMPFAVRSNASGDVVGSTRYFNVDAPNRRLEIGHTWYAQRAQRTAINTECKLLLLTYAFEVLRCIAVEFRTHWFNHRSREAILRLGAKQDGVLRNHQLMPDGAKRDTVVYSIIDVEWPAVKRHLSHKLEQR